jgi:hypothetical protein
MRVTLIYGLDMLCIYATNTHMLAYVHVPQLVWHFAERFTVPYKQYVLRVFLLYHVLRDISILSGTCAISIVTFTIYTHTFTMSWGYINHVRGDLDCNG